MRDNNLVNAEVELETPPAASPEDIAGILAKVIAHDPLPDEEKIAVYDPKNAEKFDALFFDFLKAYAAKSSGDNNFFNNLPDPLKKLLTEKARDIARHDECRKAFAILADAVAMTYREESILHHISAYSNSANFIHSLHEHYSPLQGDFPLDEAYASLYGGDYPDIWRVPDRALKQAVLDQLPAGVRSEDTVTIIPEETTLPSWRKVPASHQASAEGYSPRGIIPARMNGLLYDLAAMMAARLEAIGEPPNPELGRDQWPVVDFSQVATTNWKPHEIRAAFESRGILISEPTALTSKLTVEAAPAGLTVEAAPAGLTVEAAPAGLTIAARPTSERDITPPSRVVKPAPTASATGGEAKPAPDTIHQVRVGKP